MSQLADIRNATGFSQRGLAKLSGVGHITIARIETGGCDPRLSTLQALAKALDVKISKLVD